MLFFYWTKAYSNFISPVSLIINNIIFHWFNGLQTWHLPTQIPHIKSIVEILRRQSVRIWNTVQIMRWGVKWVMRDSRDIFLISHKSWVQKILFLSDKAMSAWSSYKSCMYSFLNPRYKKQDFQRCWHNAKALIELEIIFTFLKEHGVPSSWVVLAMWELAKQYFTPPSALWLLNECWMSSQLKGIDFCFLI